MNLKNVLSPDTVWIDLKATSKSAIIEEMIDRLHAAGKIKDRTEALKSVQDREATMSTGMQDGVAIPHGKSTSIPSLLGAVGIQKDGVDFDSMDGKPTKIFIMTLSPARHIGPHIQFLAGISRLISSAEIREKILTAETHQQIFSLLTDK